MSVQRQKIEGRSEIRIQACMERIILGIETPLQTGILYMSFSTMLTLEDSISLRDMLNNANDEIQRNHEEWSEKL